MGPAILFIILVVIGVPVASVLVAIFRVRERTLLLERRVEDLTYQLAKIKRESAPAAPKAAVPSVEVKPPILKPGPPLPVMDPALRPTPPPLPQRSPLPKPAPLPSIVPIVPPTTPVEAA